jgi:hypothetical protein
MQDAQILPVGIARPLLNQRIVGHAEMARGKQFLSVAIVREGAGLAHQPVDDVPIVDAMLVAAAQPRQMLDPLLRVPHFQVFHEETDLDLLADQPAGHGIAVAIDVNQTAAIDAGLQTLARFQAPSRQRSELGAFFLQPVTPAGIEKREPLLQELRIGFSTGEVPASAQHQGLVDGGLEAMVPLFDVAVFVGVVGLDLLAGHAVVGQQCLIPLCELFFIGEVVDGRAHAIGAMPLRDAAEFEQRILQTRAEAFKALREADRRRLPIRVGQHKMVDHVVEALPLDAHAQVVHHGEIGGAEPPGLMNLGEEDFLGRTGTGTPATDVALQRPQLVVGEAARMAPLQFFEDGLGLQPGLGFEQLAHAAPHLREGIGTRAPGVGQDGFAGPFAELAIFACGLLVHVRPPRRLGQRFAVGQQAEQLLDLLVRNHRNPPCARKLRSAYGQQLPGKSNCRQPTAVIVVGAGNCRWAGKSNCRRREE